MKAWIVGIKKLFWAKKTRHQHMVNKAYLNTKESCCKK